MTTQTEVTHRNHHRAVRFFWGLLTGATAISLIGNIAHAVLPYLSRIVVQVGAAAVPPIALLAAVHGIALAVRAGASGRVYCWAISAVAVIGGGAFAVSFLALRDLMHAIGYSTRQLVRINVSCHGLSQLTGKYATADAGVTPEAFSRPQGVPGRG